MWAVDGLGLKHPERFTHLFLFVPISKIILFQLIFLIYLIVFFEPPPKKKNHILCDFTTFMKESCLNELIANTYTNN